MPPTINSRAGGVLVCFAVPEEARPFRAAQPPGTRVLVTGMGPRRAARAVEPILAGPERPARVLTCGFAGGLDPKLACGTVVYEPTGDVEILRVLERAGARPAVIHCAATVAVTAAAKAHLRAATGADAVEMESGVISRLCREAGVACATVRVILDTADEDLPLDFNALLDRNDRLDPLKLAAAVISHPGRIPALMRLRRQGILAAEALARVLNAGLR